jgi:hypothetical protein
MDSYSQWQPIQESRVVKRAPEAGGDKLRLSLLEGWVIIDRWEGCYKDTKLLQN